MIRYMYPTKIKKAQNITNVDSVLCKKDLQIGLNEPDVATFNPNATIVLDFGKEIRGGVRILTYETQDIGCIRVRIRFGESLSECFAELGEKNATNDHSSLVQSWLASPPTTLGIVNKLGGGWRFVNRLKKQKKLGIKSKPCGRSKWTRPSAKRR